MPPKRTVDCFITLKKGETSGIPIVSRASSMKPNALGEREAIIHLQLEIDDTIFDPAIRTGIKLQVTGRDDDFDVKKVVTGLRKIKDDLETVDDHQVY